MKRVYLSRFMREGRSWGLVVDLPWASVVPCDLVETPCSEGEVGRPDMEEVIKVGCGQPTFGLGKEVGKSFLYPGLGSVLPFYETERHR